MLCKTSDYVKSYEGKTKWMYFLIEYDDFFKKYSTFWDKIRDDIKKEFASKSFYNKEFLITKTKSHGDEVTDFYDKEIPKVDSHYIWLAVITLDSALKKDENNYWQVFLREFEYIEKNVVRHIYENLSYFSYYGESDRLGYFLKKASLGKKNA